MNIETGRKTRDRKTEIETGRKTLQNYSRKVNT